MKEIASMKEISSMEERVRIEETAEKTGFETTPLNTVKKSLLLVAGSLSVVLGFLGILLPVLPTTPFLLLAAACYTRSSERLLHWLLTNRLFGEYIRRYRAGEGLPLRIKIPTILLLWVTLLSSALFGIPQHLWWVKLLLLGVGIGVTTHLCRIKTAK